jgi:hypothetical protein
MSAYHQIFARTARTGEEFAADVGAAAGVRMEKVESGGPAGYAGKRPYAAVEIELSHDFEEDYGIPFEEYPLVITFRDFDGEKAREEEFAREVFARLASSGNYSLLLVFNLSKLLERHDA